MNTDFEEQLRQLEKEYGNSDSEYTDEDDEEYDELLEDIIEDDEEGELEADFENLDLDDLYCPACEKEFNHKNAFKNHISSKKHKDNVQKLKMEMNEMESAYQESQQNGCSTQSPIHFEDDLPELSDDDAILAEEDKLEKQNSTKSKKKKNKSKPNPVHEEDDVVPDLITKSADDSDWDDGKKNKKGKSVKKPKKTKVVIKEKEESDEDEDSDFEDTKKVKKNKTKKSTKVVVGDESDFDHVCVTCHVEFDSKNKLFQHLKKMNHGVYIPKKGAAANEVSTSGKKKGRK